MRRLAPLLALFFLAACPESVGQQCPEKSISLGQFSLAFHAEHPPGECFASIDGGTVALALDDAGSSGATFCAGTAADGGPLLYLAVPGKGTGNDARRSDLLPDGGFHFAGHTDPVSGTSCGCAIAVDESFDGYLLSAPDSGPFAVLPDGGLPRITGVAATLTDHLTTPGGICGTAGDAGCNVPCPVTYTVIGSRF
jgi:hypothetical protein